MPKISKNGFTFIEIILVVSILSIISILASSFYSRFLTQNSVTNNTDHIISQLRKAQTYSIMGKQTGGTWGVKYTTSPTKQVTLYLQGNSAFDENYPINSNITLNAGGSPTFDILFTHYTGVPTGATFPLIITVTGNNSIEGLTINSQGIVSKN